MKKMLGYGFGILIGAGAITFEMLESLNFWNLAFPAEKWYLAYLGFFMTSIAMLGYFYEFLFVAHGRTQKTVSLVMTVLCGAGALLTAGVGFQITAYAATGFQFTKDEIEYMALIVQILIGLHILALLVYYGGDSIAAAWKDDDGDGIPNWLDKKDNRPQKPQQTQNQPRRVYASEAEEVAELEKRLAELSPKAKAGNQNPPTS